MHAIKETGKKISIIVGTRTGEYRQGAVPDFSARDPVVLDGVRVSPRDISFVAFPERSANTDPIEHTRLSLHGGWTMEMGVLQRRDSGILVGRALDADSGVMIVYPGAVIDESPIAEQADEPRHTRRQKPKMRLGELLIAEGLIDEDELTKALAVQSTRIGARLGEILVEMGKVSELALFQTLARAFSMELVNLDTAQLDPQSMVRLGLGYFEQHQALPLERRGQHVVLAVSDPTNGRAAEEAARRLRASIEEVLTTPSQLRRGIRRALHNQDAPAEIEHHLRPGRATAIAAEGNAIVDLARQMLEDAVREGASDIHIEPNSPERNTIVRIRIDGACRVYKRLPAEAHRPLLTRLKIMSNLDIAERRKPQDGKMATRVDDNEVELRVSSMPTVNGNEDMVLRILSASKPLPLDDLAFNPRNLSAFRHIIHQPYGMVLCVGPTGSGKTTTLHSALREINAIDRKVWTAEDPVEITQPGLRQVQVNPRIGFTFADAMRGFLRLDPDVIMIGEMRDTETSSIAIEAALTGHLVLSTLHTNSAAETITRLMDLGLNPFSVASAFRGILAQRLVRKLCTSCKEPYEAKPNEAAVVRQAFGDLGLFRRLGLRKTDRLMLWSAPGCSACHNLGYRGRLAVHELLIVNDDIENAIKDNMATSEIQAMAISGGMTTLRQDGIEKAVRGLTDFQQVLAVCGG